MGGSAEYATGNRATLRYLHDHELEEPAQLMTIVPQPVQKTLRRLEIGFGLVCSAFGLWMLVQFGLLVFGAATQMQVGSFGEAALLLGQSIYLLGFGWLLLFRGYVSLIFWVIAAAILMALPVAVGWVG
jgi:hypothetical protein